MSDKKWYEEASLMALLAGLNKSMDSCEVDNVIRNCIDIMNTNTIRKGNLDEAVAEMYQVFPSVIQLRQAIRENINKVESKPSLPLVDDIKSIGTIEEVKAMKVHLSKLTSACDNRIKEEQSKGG